MVYIYRKGKGEQYYYYLRASVRENGKTITKDIAYLGTDPLALQEKLDHIPSQYKEEIRKSYKTIKRFLTINHFLAVVQKEKPRIESSLGKDATYSILACKYHYEQQFKQLHALTQEEQLQNAIISFTFNSTAIEGNTITLHQAAKLLLEERTPKGKTLREVYDVQNTSKVFHELFSAPKPLTHEFIEDVHKKLLLHVDERTGYRYEDIRVFKSHFDATPGPYVRTDMELLLKWCAEHAQLHPFILAVLFHHKFEKIHPFMDGNGRTGRMLMNNILFLHGYPPLIVSTKKRKDYLDALGKADTVPLTETDLSAYTPLLLFMAEEYVKNYWDIFL